MTALAKAQGAFPEIERNRTVRVATRAGGDYSFKYATLSAIFTAVRKPLSENGISFTQLLSHDSDGGYYVLTTTLHHGNQYISSKVPLIAEGATNQQFGSALTYMKRYAFAALLGLSADEDDDGNIADGNTVVSAQDKVPAKTPKTPAPDPISTGKSKSIIHPADGLTRTHMFSANKIDVNLLDDESGSDWMRWGREYMEMARAAPTADDLKRLEESNKTPLANMKLNAPKMFDNLTIALTKVKGLLEQGK